MAATATKRRSKAAQEAEEQAQALKALDSQNEALAPTIEQHLRDTIAEQGGEVIDGEFTVTDDEDDEDDVDPEDAKAMEELLEEHRLAQAFKKVAEMNGKVKAAFASWEEAAEEAKTRKKRWEALADELSKMIDSTASPEPMPLFDGTAKPTTEVNPAGDAWRSVPLREALPELTDTIHSKLEGAQLFTMGELANWTAENGGRRRLTDIAGIGEAAAGKIEEATMAFWSRQKPSTAEASGEPGREKYLATAIPWDDFDEKPAPELSISTIGALERHAAGLGLSIFDTLRNLGISSLVADDVLDRLAEIQDEVMGK